MRHKPTRGEETDKPTQKTVFLGRDGLAAYTVDPEAFPPTRVVYYNDKFVVINDLYPKSSVHLLILPRNPILNIQRPDIAFDNPKFLADCREEEKKVRKIVASELRRRYGKYSAQDQPRIQALESDDPPEKLPAGRDWTKDVMSGIHANPSMSHLHIHVLSKDMVSEPMKRKNHYLSFTTDFLVGLEHFPLAKDDYRRKYKNFPEDMLCWRCGQNFQNEMTKLKEHLEHEKDSWIRE